MEFENINNEELEANTEETYTTCPECGRSISIENDGGNGFCKDCAPNH